MSRLLFQQSRRLWCASPITSRGGVVTVSGQVLVFQPSHLVPFSTRSCKLTKKEAPQNTKIPKSSASINSYYENPLRMIKDMRNIDGPSVDKNKDILVYDARRDISKYIWIASGVFYSVAAIATAVLPYNINMLLSPEIIDLSLNLNNNLLVTVFVNLFLIFQPVILRFLTKRHVFHIYYNEQKNMFTIHAQSPFLTTRKVTVKPGAIQIANEVTRNVVTKAITSFYVNRKPYQIYVEYFKIPYYYNLLYGYEQQREL
ncbi:uncharacterized protein LOC100376394 [Saccoglossus kowalevskii]|uniref:Uncharacterized protein LOC100376394 n=1 Tax=Saccoglossus kowalevskii TaxID=10224 RepID=A0ABM0H1P2_SACKO|nr:PREDICTED: uncharacterized protein LOC100376394 [Saccoglossus kowalevskii]